MVVAKRQGREKPVKIEQRKVRGPESLPQTRRGLTLLSQLCRDPAVGVRNAEEA